MDQTVGLTIRCSEPGHRVAVAVGRNGDWGQAFDSAILAGEPIAPLNSSMTRLKQHLLGTED